MRSEFKQGTERVGSTPRTLNYHNAAEQKRIDKEIARRWRRLRLQRLLGWISGIFASILFILGLMLLRPGTFIWLVRLLFHGR